MFTGKKAEKRRGSKGGGASPPPPALTPPDIDIARELETIDDFAVDQSTYCETPTNGSAKAEDHYGFLYSTSEKDQH